MKIDLEKLKEIECKYQNSIVCSNALQYMVDMILQSGGIGRMDLSAVDTPKMISYDTLKELGIIKD
jgi:hypothetical protein